MSKYKEQIEEMTWSFSRLNSFHDCKAAWKMQYIDKLEGLDNSWSSLGTYCHELLEELSNDNITSKELPILFRENYDSSVTDEFPPFAIDLHQHYKRKIGKYFDVFPDMGEAVGVEMKFEYLLPDESSFIGYIDRINRKEDGLHAIDWKVSKKFTKKKLLDKRRQIHFYFKGIKDVLGEDAVDGFFVFIQDGSYHKVDNNPTHVKETMKWAVDTIESAKKETEFRPILEGMNDKQIKEQAMFCESICSHRDKCELKKQIYGK